MASLDILITGDVSVIKGDLTNYSEEEKKKLMEKYKLTPTEVKEMVQNDDGVYEQVSEDSELSEYSE